MIFGLYKEQSRSIQQALICVCTGEREDVFQAVAVLLNDTMQRDPGAHFSTFRRSVRELAHEALDCGHLNKFETNLAQNQVDVFFEEMRKARKPDTGGSPIHKNQPLASLRREIEKVERDLLPHRKSKDKVASRNLLR